jgi:flagellar motility protein MotE (MotC chaperone)
MMPAATHRLQKVPTMHFDSSTARLARVLPALLCAMALSVPTPGRSADKPKVGGFGKPKAGSPLLSRAELRDCLARKERIRVQREETTKLQADLARDKEEITRLEKELQQQSSTLDRTSQAAVDSYNEQALARNKLIDAYEAATPAYNAKVEALTADAGAFAKACENRRYDEDDEIAIQRGK